MSASALSRFVPWVEPSDLLRGPSGVRAQAMSERGELVGDFVFDTPPASSASTLMSGRVLHCRNAPSPGATSSLAIARMMADTVAEKFALPKDRGNAKLY